MGEVHLWTLRNQTLVPGMVKISENVMRFLDKFSKSPFSLIQWLFYFAYYIGTAFLLSLILSNLFSDRNTGIFTYHEKNDPGELMAGVNSLVTDNILSMVF